MKALKAFDGMTGILLCWTFVFRAILSINIPLNSFMIEISDIISLLPPYWILSFSPDELDNYNILQYIIFSSFWIL